MRCFKPRAQRLLTAELHLKGLMRAFVSQEGPLLYAYVLCEHIL